MGPIMTLLLWGICCLLTLAVLTLCVISLRLYLKYRKYSHIPSPKRPSFFMGHLPDYLQLMNTTNNHELPLPVILDEWHKQVSSPVFVVHIADMTAVVLTDHNLVKEVVMQSKNDKSHQIMHSVSNMFGQRFLGNGLFSIPDYETWKPRRQLYDDSFRKSYLQSILPTFNDCVNSFICKLRPLANGTTQVFMKEHLAEVTLDVISKAAFSTDFSKGLSDQMMGLRYAKSNGRSTFLLEYSLSGMTKNMHIPLFKYLHPHEAESYRETVRAVRAIGRECIKKRIRMVDNEENVPNDILTHILQTASIQDEVNIEVLVDDFVTYYVAGQETTSNTLAFAVILICQHPMVFDRLQAEVKEVLGTNTTITKEDLDKL